MSEIFRVACVENCAGDSLSENLARIDELIDDAVSHNPQLICLPEFYCLLEESDSAYLSEKYCFEKHPALLHGREMAERINCWVLLGSIPVFVGQNKIKNRSVVLNPLGQIAGTYDKVHLFDVSIKDGQRYEESKTVSPGDRASIVDLPWGACGLTICYDVRFPHLYRNLAQNGAKFITIPAAFTYKTGKAHWHTLVRARAIETGCYVFAPSQCGTRNWGRKTFGHSLIVDPWGEILAEGTGAEGVITADIKLSTVDKVRNMIPALMHDRVLNFEG